MADGFQMLYVISLSPDEDDLLNISFFHHIIITTVIRIFNGDSYRFSSAATRAGIRYACGMSCKWFDTISSCRCFSLSFVCKKDPALCKKRIYIFLLRIMFFGGKGSLYVFEYAETSLFCS